jgi:hypothetical protein
MSPTSTPENDEEYEDKKMNYEAERQTRQRHSGKDLIWRTSMQRQEYNLNQRRCECRCDRREAEICAARMRVWI